MKIRRKKKVVFRVIGNHLIGLGHVYRSLSIARELNNYDIFFISDISNKNLLNNLVKPIYPVLFFSKDKIINEIIKMKPNLLINDILATKKNDVLPIKKQNINVINFEDLGVGSKYANLTINEIYDKPKNRNRNTYWGSKYFFLRDEFIRKKKINFRKNIREILITFGGTDQYNLSLRCYKILKSICKINNIKIHIVIGPGNKYFNLIYKKVFNDNNVEVHYSTGIMSKIMSKCDVAISSNGRTVFELAHMNVPSIIISQHKRELTHSFSNKKNGFIPLGLYNPKTIEKLISRN